MARGFPSMTALLALLAVAGYQNRDKIAEMIGRLGGSDPKASGPGSQQSSLNDVLNSLRGALGSTGIGGLLNRGISELEERFKQSGQGDVAKSWINQGPNKEIAPHQLKETIGQDVLQELSRRTGLPPEELLARLSRELPDAVDRYTPEGRLPT